MRSSKKTYCCNCGLYGHIYKTCNEPITSCGIVLYKHFGNKICESLWSTNMYEGLLWKEKS